MLALLSAWSSVASAQQPEPVAVTIADLLRSPERYSGKDVVFDGVLVGKTVFATPEGIPGRGPGQSQRHQFVLADMTGARIIVLTWLPSYDLPTSGMVGVSGIPYSVRGVFYHVPMEPGPPLQFVVPRSKEGLRKK
jgi:hypothetical protein